MNFSVTQPPAGTLRDWVDARAGTKDAGIYFTDGASPLEWRDLRQEARKIAGQLTAAGARHGESIAIVQPNGREGVLAFFGAVYGGFRATMINLAAGREAIAYALQHSGARFALVHDSVADLYTAAAPDGMIRLDLATARCDAALHDVQPGDHALLMYTSGTTGRPKGVLHSQSSLLAGGWTTAIAHALGPQDRALCVLPMCHINGLCVSVMGALVSGGSVIMAPRFSASGFWDQVDRFGATWFSVVPTIISHLLHGDAVPSAQARATLRFGRSASSALAPDVQRAFEVRFEVPLSRRWG